MAIVGYVRKDYKEVLENYGFTTLSAKPSNIFDVPLDVEEGHIVLTYAPMNELIMVSRQTLEGKILSVLWEKENAVD